MRHVRSTGIRSTVRRSYSILRSGRFGGGYRHSGKAAVEYVLITTDFHTKWVEAQAFTSIKAADVKNFCGGTLFAGLGYPETS